MFFVFPSVIKSDTNQFGARAGNCSHTINFQIWKTKKDVLVISLSQMIKNTGLSPQHLHTIL